MQRVSILIRQQHAHHVPQGVRAQLEAGLPSYFLDRRERIPRGNKTQIVHGSGRGQVRTYPAQLRGKLAPGPGE